MILRLPFYMESQQKKVKCKNESLPQIYLTDKIQRRPLNRAIKYLRYI